ncbi:MAG: DUF2269 domain-containing protein [Cellvibrionales bacterium]|nr:DUF2269 domain-containing protein [Cellvibrionales bacterium]
MAEYHFLKLIHILSAVIMTGTGIGLAYFLLLAVVSQQQKVILAVTRWVIWGDWVFTTPAIITQILSGVWLVNKLGWSYQSPGLQWVLGLYALMLACWLPVIAIQYKLYFICHDTQVEFPNKVFYRYFACWVVLGCIALACVAALFSIMVFKPFLFFV